MPAITLIFAIVIVAIGIPPQTSLSNIAEAALLQQEEVSPSSKEAALPQEEKANEEIQNLSDMLVDVIKQFQDTEFGEIPVNKIILKKSVLTPQGPIYSNIVVIHI